MSNKPASAGPRALRFPRSVRKAKDEAPAPGGGVEVLGALPNVSSE
jgi:hypothetical protein